jgi:hypothetical protein
MQRFFTWILVLVLISCKKDTGDLTPPSVTSFKLENIKVVSSTIDESKKIITLLVPYQTVLKNLQPTLTLSTGASVVPSSGTVQDFTKPIYYTLTSASGVKVIYTVLTQTQEQPQPQVLSLDKEVLEAGETLVVKGKCFGNFGLDVSTYLIDSLSKETLVPNTLKDSTSLSIALPYDLLPTNYSVKVAVKQKSATSSKKVLIRYPSPVLKTIPQNNLLQGDTIWVTGTYLDTKKYTFQLSLSNSINTYWLPAFSKKTGTLYVLTDTKIADGNYEVSIKNTSENKQSSSFATKITFYDANKPFVSSFLKNQATYKVGEQVSFTTLNMDKFSIRYYQVQLTRTAQNGSPSDYYQNGLYDAATKTLSIVLPATIQKGTYQLSFSLTNPSQNYSYTISIDNTLTIL